MKTIIIEDCIYKITDREFKVLEEKLEKARQQATLGHKQKFLAEEELGEYLDVAKILYRFVGTIDFHYQR